DGDGSHGSTSKTPSYTKSVSWHHYRTFESINSDDIKTLKLSVPNFEEQQKIATVLSAADDEIATLEKKLACLKDEKKALMQQLLTGKRRVKIDEAVAA
ncbi:restriction endonuclease subunit S, partial [Escherichia coli]|uniref:restriction endonuclease subunit S n=1 Tax=Escherichia coli TaxID=562 RepID=UPI00207C13EC